MSSDDGKSSDVMCCASCGVAAIDDVELKKCTCNLVRYCSDECQKNHRPQHEKLCKRRMTELRDRGLFTQPDGNHLGECPICCLLKSIDPTKSIFTECCSKSICNGCHHANRTREIEEGLQQRCVFCREPAPKTDEEADKKIMRRIKENNDPAAMCHMGTKSYEEGDYETALKYFTKAAELGDAVGHYQLSYMYRVGQGVEKDTEKEVYHAEEAAIAGHPAARNNLGCFEANNGRFDRAKKHWIIAANLGYNDSLKSLRQLYEDGQASKEDYANALRAYQAAVAATKSAEREEAERFSAFVASVSRS